MTPTRCPLSPSELRALTAYVETGSLKDAAYALGIRPGTVKNELNTARRRTGRTTEQMIYDGTLAGWLRVRRAAA